MLKPRVEVKVVDGVLVAEFWDCLRLDPVPVGHLRRELEAHLQRGGRPDLVVNLLGVDFAGSSVLGAFVAIQRTCRAQSGRLVFCNVERGVLEVFRVSNLEPLFQFVADVPAALALLSGTAPAEPLAAPPNGSPPASSRAPLARRRRTP
jgi:anti-anti-sigma factor